MTRWSSTRRIFRKCLACQIKKNIKNQRCQQLKLPFIGFEPKISFLDSRYIDHGDGVLTLRIYDPFVFDSGYYSCTVSSKYGECETKCAVDIEESEDNLLDILPEFLKHPLPSVALPGSIVSFCTRVTPIDSQIHWSVCGREINSESKGFSVSANLNY